jgi:hypothetical protein
MDKYVGKTIKLMDNNEYQDRKDVVSAELLSSANGEIYKINNEIYLGHPGIKILPELPGNLISRPTLSWVYRSKAGGEQKLEVSYMTSGMSWNADYILVAADGKAASAMSGWVTLNNRSGGEFEDAKLKLVAGNVNRAPREERAVSFLKSAAPVAADMGGGAAFKQSELFEYYLYDLQRPTTLKNNQTKQINLMEARGITIEKEYTTTSSRGFSSRYEPGRPDKQPVTAFFAFKNTQENKLGNPLPAGVIRMYTTDAAGKQQFIGEDRISHTPKNEELRLKVGEAFDIVAESSQKNFQQITSKQSEAEWAVTLRNRKEEDVTVGVIERFYGTWEVRESSHKYKKVDATTLRFDVPVKKGEEAVVKFKIRTGI